MKDENRIDTERDRIPPEVATEMLCDPKVKLSGSMRRKCREARATVYPSARPIVRPMLLDNATGKLSKLPYEYVDEPKEPTDHTAKVAAGATCSQLLKWCKRLVKYRRIAQQRWQRAKDRLETAENPGQRKALQDIIDHYDRLVRYTIEPRLELFEGTLALRHAGKDRRA